MTDFGHILLIVKISVHSASGMDLAELQQIKRQLITKNSQWLMMAAGLGTILRNNMILLIPGYGPAANILHRILMTGDMALKVLTDI